MKREHYTFQDIIELNHGDWDKAYDIIQLRIQEKRLEKKIYPGEVILYFPDPDLIDPELIHDNFFTDPLDPYNARFGS